MSPREIERLDSGILIPGGAKDLRLRDRSRPRPVVGAGIGGWFQLELIDRRGRLIWEHQQHNLFLDSGLNRIGQSVGGAGPTSMDASSDITHCAVGTGSTEPDAADTALDNEIARTNSVAPGAPDRLRRVANGVYELERTFQFGFDEGNGNLTELAFCYGSGATDLWMRELIRDSGGTPITLTKTSDFLLRAKYTLRFTLTPTTPTAGAFTVDGWGALNGLYMFRGAGGGISGTNSLDYKVFRRAAAGSDPRGLAAGVVASTSYSSSQSLGSYGDISSTSVQVSGFTPGTWERQVDALFGVSQANGVIATLAAWGSSAVPGFIFVIDEADRHEKDNEHTLTIERIIGVTWGRA